MTKEAAQSGAHLSVAALAGLVDGRVVGDADRQVDHVDSLDQAGSGAVTFATGRRFARALSSTRATVVLLEESLLASCPTTAIVVDNAHVAFARAARHFAPAARTAPGIHPSAVIDEDVQIDDTASVGPLCVVESGARIGPGVTLGPGCHVGSEASIGKDTRLIARVTVLERVRIGARCLVQPGAVLGSEGFGLALDGGRWVRVPQLGTVIIGDDVDIGANTTIDRGAIQDTVIADGVKLDNLIQIAHNVEIGEHSAIAGCAGLAGSSRVGRHCTLAGGVGLAGHLELADNVHVTGMSMVTRSIREPGVYSAGTPLDSNRHWHRNAVRFKQLDRMARRLDELEARLAGMDSAEGAGET
ncbi:MAG: UDP-3-O-(3-hydroxymyristoyl)glucosamine N-acyltransferase [Halothiobacillaceae bacterium]